MLSSFAVSPGTYVSVTDIAAGLFKYVPPGDLNGSIANAIVFRVNDGGLDPAATNRIDFVVSATADRGIAVFGDTIIATDPGRFVTST